MSTKSNWYPPEDAERPSTSDDSFGDGATHALWFASDFVLGAGCVILQPETSKIVLIWDYENKYWMLPRGRKDLRESLEQAALREGYEETGYRAKLLPLYIPSRAPRPSEQSISTVVEPFYVSLVPFLSRKFPPREEHKGGTYITSWFVAQITRDAVIEPDHTYLENESTFETHLLYVDDAVQKLEQQAPAGSQEAKIELLVVRKAIELWRRTQAIQEGREALDIPKDIGSSKIDRKYWE